MPSLVVLSKIVPVKGLLWDIPARFARNSSRRNTIFSAILSKVAEYFFTQRSVADTIQRSADVVTSQVLADFLILSSLVN
jgi:hypothetical protein